MTVPSVVQSTMAANVGSATLAINKPAGGAAGDVYVIFVYHEEVTSAPTVSCTGFSTITGPAGGYTYGSKKIYASVLWKAHSGSEGSTFSVVASAGAVELTCLLIRGADTVNPPIIGTINGYNDGNNQTLNCNGLTTLVNDCLGVIFWADTNGSIGTVSASTWALHDTNQESAVLTKSLTTAGVVSGVTVNWSGNASLSAETQMFAFAPASGTTDITGTSATVAVSSNVGVTGSDPVKIADRGIRTSTSAGDATVTLTNPTQIAIGNYLVARVAVDNSGSSGARPGLTTSDVRNSTWAHGTGALQDPGAASAGISVYLCYVEVTTAYRVGDTVLFDYTTGSPLSAIVIEEWANIDTITPLAVAEVQANNVSTTAQPALSRTPTAVGQLMYVAAGIEGLSSYWGAQDSDSTGGTWSDVTKDQANTGTGSTSVSVYGGYKVVTSTAAQTWNNTLGTTSDWAACAVVFAKAVTTTNIIGSPATVAVSAGSGVAAGTASVTGTPASVAVSAGSATLTETTAITGTSAIVVVTAGVGVVGFGFIDPTSITNCIAWVDADDISTFSFSSGTTISHWIDKSVSEIDFFVDVAGATRDANSLNGRGVVSFISSGKLRGIYHDVAQPITTFFVFKMNAAGNGVDHVISDGRGGAGGNGYEFGTQSAHSNDLYIDAGTARSYVTLVRDIPHYATAIWNGASSSLRLDGSQVIAPTNVGTKGIDDDIFLGASRYGGSAMNGYIAEYIAYDRELTAGEITDVENYLYNKWFVSSSVDITGTSATVATQSTSATIGVAGTFTEDFTGTENTNLANGWADDSAFGASDIMPKYKSNRGSTNNSVASHVAWKLHGLGSLVAHDWQMDFDCNASLVIGNGGVAIALLSNTTFAGLGIFIGNAVHIQVFSAGGSHVNITNVDRPGSTGSLQNHITLTHRGSDGFMEAFVDGVSFASWTDNTQSAGNMVYIALQDATSPTNEAWIDTLVISDTITGPPGAGTNITGTSATVVVTAGSATLTANTAITGTPASVAVHASSATVSGNAAITGTPTSVAVHAGSATVSGQANVIGSSAVVAINSGTGTLTATTAVTGTSATVAITAGSGVISLAVIGTPATVVVTAGSAVVTGNAAVTGTSATVVVHAGSAVVTGNAAVTGTSAIVVVNAGSAVLTANTAITGTPATVVVTAGPAILTATTSITGTSATVNVSAGSATIVLAVSVTGASAVVAVHAGTGTIGVQTDITGTPATVAVHANSATVTGYAAITGTSATVAVHAGTGTIGTTDSITGTSGVVTVTAGTGIIGVQTAIIGIGAVIAVLAGSGQITAEGSYILPAIQGAIIIL